MYSVIIDHCYDRSNAFEFLIICALARFPSKAPFGEETAFYDMKLKSRSFKHKGRRRRRRKIERKAIAANIDIDIQAFADDFRDLSRIVGATHMSQVLGASFAWAHDAMMCRQKELRMSTDQIERCWKTLVSTAGKYLTPVNHAAIKRIRFESAAGRRLGAAMRSYWVNSVHALCTVTPMKVAMQDIATEQTQEAAKSIATRILSSELPNSKSHLAEEQNKRIAKPLKRVTSIPSLIKKLSTTGLPSVVKKEYTEPSTYAATMTTASEELLGSYLSTMAFVSAVCELMASCNKTFINGTQSCPSLLRWYLQSMGHLQAQWIGSSRPTNQTQSLSLVFKMSEYDRSTQGKMPLGWLSTKPSSQYYIWPALVYHAERILAYERGSSNQLRLEKGIDLERLFDMLDLKTCTAYALAEVMEDREKLIVAYHDPSTDGQVLKHADDKMPVNDKARIPPLSLKQLHVHGHTSMPSAYRSNFDAD